jgi:hypothetical protein
MPDFFPRQTIEWRLEEPPAFRRLSLSVLEMGLLTGVALRILRALTFTHADGSLIAYGVAFVIGAVGLVGMATAHLASYPIRVWLWRAPAFAAVEVVGEMLTSLALIALHREHEGSARAEFHDWPAMALRALLQNELIICLWAILLAGVIVFIRRSGMADNVEGEALDLVVEPTEDPPR